MFGSYITDTQIFHSINYSNNRKNENISGLDIAEAVGMKKNESNQDILQEKRILIYIQIQTDC